MPEGVFVGLDRETLVAIRDKAVEMILEGKTIMSYSGGAASASKQFAMPPKQMLEEAKYALEKMDGRVRGLWTNYNRFVDR